MLVIWLVVCFSPRGMPPQVEDRDREVQGVATKLYSVTADGNFFFNETLVR